MREQLSVTSLLLPTPGDVFGAVIFLALLVTWGVGVLACLMAVQHYQRNPPRTNSESVAELEEELSCIPDRMALATPAVLIMIGLLGTFVGIAGAISEASKTLTVTDGVSADTLRNLSGVLELIGLKFKSSAWGLLASLALRPVVLAMPIRKRHKLARDSAIENARQARARVEAQAQALGQIRDHAQSLTRLDGLMSQLVDAANVMRSAASTSATASGHLEASVKSFSSSTQTLLDHATSAITGSLRDSGQQMEGAVGTLTALARSIETTLSDRLNTINEALVAAMMNSGKQLADSSRENVKDLQLALGSVKELITQIEGNSKKQTESLGTKTEESTRVLSDSLERLETAMNAQAEANQRETAKVSKATTDALSEFGKAQKTQSDVFATSMVQLQGALERMAATVDQLTRLTVRIEATLVNGEDMKGELQEAIKKLNKSLGTIAGDFLQATRAFQKLTKEPKLPQTPAPVPATEAS